jgi:hypothetical protein
VLWGREYKRRREKRRYRGDMSEEERELKDS